MAVANLESSFGSLDIKQDNKSLMTTDSTKDAVLRGGEDTVEAKDSAVETESKDGTIGLPYGHADFVTMGMFIVDEIEYLPPKPPVRGILGGAGAYAALGARLFSPAPHLSRSVGWIVDKGHDFPIAMGELIESWQTAVIMRYDSSRATTRGWNGYDEAERRAFHYMTPKKRITAEDLPPQLLTARSFHICSSASRCRELVTEIKSKRKAAIEALGPDAAHHPDIIARPYFIWEPVPDLCTPDELLNCTNTLPLVDVCSPNHSELAAYMGDPHAGLDPETGKLNKAAVERACEQLLSAMPLQSYALVVRAAEHGCYVAKNGGRRRLRADQSEAPRKKKSAPKQDLHGGLRPDIDMEALFAGLVQNEEGSIARDEVEFTSSLEVWIPAVSGEEAAGDSEDSEYSEYSEYSEGNEGGNPKSRLKVVDPTGGGNAFLGGFAVGLARGKTLDEAAAWGNVSASFAIEQVGVPVLGQDADGNETWNGVRVEDRYAAYEALLKKKGLLQE